MIVEFKADKIGMYFHGDYVTVECYKRDRCIRITGPFSSVRGEILGDSPCTVTVVNQKVTVVTTVNEEKLVVLFSDRPSIRGGLEEE